MSQVLWLFIYAKDTIFRFTAEKCVTHNGFYMFNNDLDSESTCMPPGIVPPSRIEACQIYDRRKYRKKNFFFVAQILETKRQFSANLAIVRNNFD